MHWLAIDAAGWFARRIIHLYSDPALSGDRCVRRMFFRLMQHPQTVIVQVGPEPIPTARQYILKPTAAVRRKGPEDSVSRKRTGPIAPAQSLLASQSPDKPNPSSRSCE
jgi:hypothetical protein